MFPECHVVTTRLAPRADCSHTCPSLCKDKNPVLISSWASCGGWHLKQTQKATKIPEGDEQRKCTHTDSVKHTKSTLEVLVWLNPAGLNWTHQIHGWAPWLLLPVCHAVPSDPTKATPAKQSFFVQCQIPHILGWDGIWGPAHLPNSNVCAPRWLVSPFPKQPLKDIPSKTKQVLDRKCSFKTQHPASPTQSPPTQTFRSRLCREGAQEGDPITWGGTALLGLGSC